MKFNNLPYLVSKEILSHLPVADLLIFSQCSKKHMSYIRNLLKHELPKIGHFSICSFEDEDSWQIDGELYSYIEMMPSSKVGDSTVCKLRLFGMELSCCPATDHKPMTVFGEKEHEEYLLLCFYNSIYTLFGHLVKYHLNVIKMPTSRRLKQTYYIPKLQPITKCAIESWYTKELEKNLKDLLLVSPNMEYLSLTQLESCDFFDIPRIPEIEIDWFHGNFGEFLRKFTGKRLRVDCVHEGQIDSTTVVEFLSAWNSKIAYGNIEALKVECDSTPFNVNEIMEKCDVKQLDFQVEFKYQISAACGTFEESFESHHYIVRESDGRVASLKITPECFEFGVWNWA